MRRLMRELTELKNSPPEGIRVQTNEDNMLDVTGIIQGPGTRLAANTMANRVRLTSGRVVEGTPYAGGYFRVKFRFTEEFPAAPPKCTSTLLIGHCCCSSCFGGPFGRFWRTRLVRFVEAR